MGAAVFCTVQPTLNEQGVYYLGPLKLKSMSSSPPAPSSGTYMFALNGAPSWVNASDGYTRTLTTTTLTANRTYTLQNQSGTIVGTTQTQTLTNTSLLTGFGICQVQNTSDTTKKLSMLQNGAAASTVLTLQFNTQSTSPHSIRVPENNSYIPQYVGITSSSNVTPSTTGYNGGVVEIYTDVVAGHITVSAGGHAAGTLQFALYQTSDGTHPRTGHTTSLVAYTNFTPGASQISTKQAFNGGSATFKAGFIVIIFGSTSSTGATVVQCVDNGAAVSVINASLATGEGPCNFTNTTAPTTTPPSTLDVTAQTANTSSNSTPTFVLSV